MTSEGTLYITQNLDRNGPDISPGSNRRSLVISITVTVLCFVIVVFSYAVSANKKPANAVMASVDQSGVVTFRAPVSGQTDNQAHALYVTEIPRGYRDWRLISVAHEEGNLNDIRAILGNDVSIKSYREGKLPFPEGAIIARIAWKHIPSEENNKIFGRQQSFIAGDAPEWYLQFMVKDSKKYAATGGWGFAQFDKDGKPAGEAAMKSCFPCHQNIQSRDLVFTQYAP